MIDNLIEIRSRLPRKGTLPGKNGSALAALDNSELLEWLHFSDLLEFSLFLCRS